MSILFWRPSLRGRAAAKQLVSRAAVLGLGLLLPSVFLFQPAFAQARPVSEPQQANRQQATTMHVPAVDGLSPRFDTFVRGPDGTLWHRGWENGTWYDWESLGGSLDSAPTAVSDGNLGMVDVFYLSGGEIKYVYLEVTNHSTYIMARGTLGPAPADVVDPDDCASHWYDPPYGFCSPFAFTSAPAVAITGPNGRLDVFALASDTHHLLHRWTHDDGSWSNWELLSVANFSGDPAAVSWGPDRTDVFIHGSDTNHLYDKVYTNGHWQGWQDLGGTPLYSPAVASWAPGRLDVFAVGTDHQLWTKWYSNGQWSGAGTNWDGWAPLGGYFIASPAAGSLGPGALDVVGVGHDYQLYHSWWGGKWSPWAGMGVVGSFHDAPAVADSWQQF